MDFLTSLLDNIEEALVVTDTKANILFFNGVAADISRNSDVPLDIGKNMFEIVSEERRKTVVEIFKELEEKKEVKRSFAEYRDKYNSIIYLEFKYIPVVDDEDLLTHIFIIFRDITPQKLFEKKLTTQASNISNLIDKANAIVIGLDTQGYITDWNLHCSEITGFSAHEVFARKFSDLLLSPEDKMIFDELMANVLTHEVLINYEIRVLTKKKEQRQFLLNSSVRASESGNVIGVVFIGQDATELLTYRKSLERQVEERTYELQRALAKEKEVVEMKSRFVSVASHEFRTPLSSIEYATRFVKENRGRINSDELSAKLESIEKQVRHMTHLLDDVLTYGKSEAGKIKLQLSTIELTDFIHRIVEEVGHSTKNTHVISLQLNIPRPIIPTDEKLLRNIMINLLTNAIKFSPGQRYVYLDVSLDGKLKFTVRDEGIGIPQGEFNTIFEPFERGKSVGSIQGTGLGLSIVKKAVELLNGQMKIESEVGKGTVISVTIPLSHEN